MHRLERQRKPLFESSVKKIDSSEGHFDALLVGTEVGVLVDNTPETMAAV
jgi:hypothetical protein